MNDDDYMKNLIMELENKGDSGRATSTEKEAIKRL